MHLKVSNLEKSLEFYCGVLGFQITQRYGSQAAFVSAGGYHHHIGLNTWHSKNSSKAPTEGVGLYHAAIVYEDRKDLAEIFKRLLDLNYPLTGASDHGVSEAIYLDDPDGNGIELYWDRPKDQWPINADGGIEMFTNALDVQSLLSELRN